MALLHTDSFDNYTNMAQKYDSVSALSISTTAARNGLAGALVSSGGGANIATKNFPGSQILIMGFAINCQAAPGTGGIFVQVVNAGTIQIIFGINTTGAVYFYRGFLTTLLGLSTLLVSPLNAWHYVEFSIVVSSSANVGSIVCRVDQQVVFTFNGSTSADGNSQWNQITFGYNGQGGPATLWYDDLVIMDGTGNSFNSFLGDITVVSQLPVSNGIENDFTRGGSTINPNNYQQVNENPPDDNTSYVFSNLVNAKELYSYPSLSQTSGICYGGMLWPRLQKDDAGGRLYRGLMSSQGVTVDSGTDIPAVQGYIDKGLPFSTDPATGLQYTLAGINAAQSGIVITG